MNDVERNYFQAQRELSADLLQRRRMLIANGEAFFGRIIEIAQGEMEYSGEALMEELQPLARPLEGGPVRGTANALAYYRGVASPDTVALYEGEPGEPSEPLDFAGAFKRLELQPLIGGRDDEQDVYMNVQAFRGNGRYSVYTNLVRHSRQTSRLVPESGSLWVPVLRVTRLAMQTQHLDQLSSRLRDMPDAIGKSHRIL